MMEAASTSEISVNFYQTAQHYKPEDSHLVHSLEREEFQEKISIQTTDRR
jgi:hypothetical protein